MAQLPGERRGTGHRLPASSQHLGVQASRGGGGSRPGDRAVWGSTGGCEVKVGVRNAHRPNANNELGDMTPGEEALMRSCKSGHCGQACLERAHRHFTPGRAPPVPQGGRLGVTVLPHSARLRPSWLPPAPVCVAGGRVFPGKVCRSAHSSLFCTTPSSLHPVCPARTHNRLAHTVPFLQDAEDGAQHRGLLPPQDPASSQRRA